jgi:Tol biopolymer transport system component
MRILLKADAVYPFFNRPVWSPDGSLVVFSRSGGGIAQEIWLVPAAGGQPRRMWQDPPGVFSADPAFTPDGRGVVHTSSRGGATNLWVMPIDGQHADPSHVGERSRSGAERCADRGDRVSQQPDARHAARPSVRWGSDADGGHASFRPLGRRRFPRMDGKWRLRATRLTVPGTSGRYRSAAVRRDRSHRAGFRRSTPRYTSDGSAILFQTWGSEPRRIWRAPRDGGQPAALTPARGEHDEYADMSPDGRWLAFARTEGGTARVYISPTGGGEARRLTESSSTTPRWSPDGQWIAYGFDRSFSGGDLVDQGRRD